MKGLKKKREVMDNDVRFLGKRMRAWRDSEGLKPCYREGDTGTVTGVKQGGGLKIKIDGGSEVFWCDSYNWETIEDYEQRLAMIAEREQ